MRSRSTFPSQEILVYPHFQGWSCSLATGQVSDCLLKDSILNPALLCLLSKIQNLYFFQSMHSFLSLQVPVEYLKHSIIRLLRFRCDNECKVV